MDKKKQIYIILALVGKNTILLTLRVVFSSIAGLAYSVKLVVKMLSDNPFADSVVIIADFFFVFMSMLVFIISAIQLR